MREGKIIYDEAARFDDGSPVRPRSGMMKVSSTEQGTGRAGGKAAAAGLPVLPRPRRLVLPMPGARQLSGYGIMLSPEESGRMAELVMMSRQEQDALKSPSDHEALAKLWSLTPAQRRRYKHKAGHQLALEGKPFGEQHRRPGGVSSGNVTTWRAPTPGGGTLKWGEKATKGLDRIASMRPFARRGR